LSCTLKTIDLTIYFCNLARKEQIIYYRFIRFFMKSEDHFELPQVFQFFFRSMLVLASQGQMDVTNPKIDEDEDDDRTKKASKTN